MPRTSYLILIFLLWAQSILAQQAGINVIPAPLMYTFGNGNFILNQSTVGVISTTALENEWSIFNNNLQKLFGISLAKKTVPVSANYIELILEPNRTNESYSIDITSNKITINGSKAGIFYGLQTILQLINISDKKNLIIPVLKLTDAPRFQWRGMHLDVSRHFFKPEFIKKYIDYLAMYKMNVFHWHLTDDQGWRIEIKKYPLLTQVGSKRKGSLIGHATEMPEKFDTLQQSGFYTQNEIRELVAYAAKRHITIVPEIEMPGHAVAALASYPEYSCTANKVEVEKKWGVFDDVFCPKNETFVFLENILSEVMELFPGKYIHIGGDECPKTNWKKCAHCQSLIKEQKLKDEHELQSYFIQRIEKFVNLKGRSIIGWDEILEGGLAPNAAVMSWRGTQGGIDAAKQKHFVVMSPGSHCYFDHYQGNPRNEPLAIGGLTPIEKVYDFEPIPDALSAEEQKYILGAQANVWTEYIPTPERVEYMIFPRICALAEALWSPKEKKNYTNFQNRLKNHFSLLDKLQINYAKSIYK